MMHITKAVMPNRLCNQQTS